MDSIINHEMLISLLDVTSTLRVLEISKWKQYNSDLYRHALAAVRSPSPSSCISRRARIRPKGEGYNQEYSKINVS